MTAGPYAKSARGGHGPVPLVDHLVATRQAAKRLRERIGTLSTTVAGDFWMMVELAAVSHDLGKLARGFQDMIAGRIRAWGQRHELLSLGFLSTMIPEDDLRLWIGSAIITHHWPLTAPTGSPSRSIASRYAGLNLDDLRDELGPVDDETTSALCRWLTDAPVSMTGDALVEAAHAEFDRILDRWTEPVGTATGLAAVLLQGALTLADHLSSAGGFLHDRQPIDAAFPARLARRLGGPDRLHPHQRDCGELPGHLLLRSPTGSGKTEAGLLWAAHQVEAIAAATGGTPRVFLTLPYLASINAMAGRLGRTLGDPDLVGVAHSRAASYHLANATALDDSADPRTAARKAVSRAAATRLFRETVRVTTPYQLLRAALAGPAHSSILVDTANSVIVLDELHAYDATRLGYILASARLWERLGCRIAVLSATLPAALAELVGQALRAPVTTIVGAPGPARHRIRRRQCRLTDPASVAEIAARVEAGRSVLVVANNVAHAQALFETLAPSVRARHGDDAAILLHSRFKRGHRAEIEARLADRYASGTPERRPGLVVATQVVEVSLDLDLDTLCTSAAPLEALLQRFGRVNRRGARPPADVVIFQPEYGPRRGQAPDKRYADGVYPAEPVELGLSILERHDGQPVDEAEATGWLDEVYASEWGQGWRSDVATALITFDRDFLRFQSPFEARDDLEARFDELFEGTEAVLYSDREAYAARLDTPPGARPGAAGRLLGEELLIPLPHWATAVAAYDKRLRVPVVDGVYDEERGLISVRPVRGVAVYQPGEVL